MTHLLYTHTRNVSILEAMTRWIRQTLPIPSTTSPGGYPRRVWPKRLLVFVTWLTAIVVQAGLIWMVAELVQLAHGLMDLWLELATQQLDLTSLYVAATNPK